MHKFIIFCTVIIACYAAPSPVTDSTIIARQKRCELHHGQKKAIEEQTESTGDHKKESHQSHSPLGFAVEEKGPVNKLEDAHQHGLEMKENTQELHHEHANKELLNEQKMEHSEKQHEHERLSHKHEHSEHEHEHKGHSHNHEHSEHEGHLHIQNDQAHNQEKEQIKVEKQDLQTVTHSVPTSEQEIENKDSISDSIGGSSTPTLLEDSALRRKPIPVSELFSRTKAAHSDRT